MTGTVGATAAIPDTEPDYVTRIRDWDGQDWPSHGVVFRLLAEYDRLREILATSLSPPVSGRGEAEQLRAQAAPGATCGECGRYRFLIARYVEAMTEKTEAGDVCRKAKKRYRKAAKREDGLWTTLCEIGRRVEAEAGGSCE